MNDKSRVEPIKIRFPVEQGDFVRAGEASSKIKRLLLQLGFSADVIRRAAIATYEAEMNIVIHSWGGFLEAEINPLKIIITAQDKGPGIPDVELAMEAGYSTAPEHIREMGFGAGMGLPNMRSCANEFTIESQAGKGTRVKMAIWETEEQA
ncbi:MAG: ATP-binding protein [Peptococcaceae bacterium]|jgi:anti-sigma regulatory factor (Ser/Thr protein kinase)|nr:ATP-binding protein [Peptococcaceae bacterium]MDH7525551.1 ATP-binding protein [Peptococcaceae bacterium]